VKDLYQAIANEAKISGDNSLALVPKILDLMENYKGIGDTEGVQHCVNWIQEIAWKHPLNAEYLRRKVSSQIRKQIKDRPKRLRRRVVTNQHVNELEF